ncbi:MAG TPA: hypothetical protein VFC86_13590 [Planctomycetota bacterium]|nr:hypothetical protein [Planctomycetota bacterium]
MLKLDRRAVVGSGIMAERLAGGNAAVALLTKERAQGSALLVTLGCGEECPVLPGVRVEDWPLEDPKGKAPERVREIRDAIRGRIVRLLQESGWEKS